MRKIIGSIIMILGMICILGAGGLVVYNYIDSQRAGKASREILDKLEQAMDERANAAADSQEDSLSDDLEEAIADPSSGSSAAKAKLFLAMPTEEIDGQRYIGRLDVPSMNISLPVMENWDYERLKVSPCRFTGSYYYDDLVICAHNYARHFSPLKGIGIGVEVNFTTVTGKVYHYKTSNVETIDPINVKEMTNNVNNDTKSKSQWDMTLFTCNSGGQTRCAIRCIRSDR